MSKRIKKKKNKYIIDNIQKFNLAENECLVFKYNSNSVKPNAIAQFAEHISNTISNKILFVPDDMQVFKVTETRKEDNIE